MKTGVYFLVLLLSLSAYSAIADDFQVQPIYFDLGEKLVEEFKGTYIFNYKKLEFIKDGPSSYIIKSSGDQSPGKAHIHIRNDYTYWASSRNNENWFVIKNFLKKGDRWQNTLREWKQTYEVIDTDITLDTPAGTLEKCAKIKISWIAHEHDVEGLQEIILYLAPYLAIVKLEHYDNGNKWHEDILTGFKKILK